MKIIVPEAILHQIASKCKPNGSRDYFVPSDLAEPLEYFISNRLESLDSNLYKKYKYLHGISDRTLRHAWANDGNASNGVTEDLLNLLCYFGFGKNWSIVKNDLGIKELLKVSPDYKNKYVESGNSRIRELNSNDSILMFSHRILIELTTRKAALPINLSEESIDKIYDSWYELFQIIRVELKSIPPFQLNSTPVKYANEIMNIVLRPHLTQFQANFRRWYETNKSSNKFKNKTIQELQQNYPYYLALTESLLKTNKLLQEYVKLFEGILSDSITDS